MVIGMPLVIMVVFGLVLTGEVKNVPVVIDNADVGYTATVGRDQTISLTLGGNLTGNLQADDRLQVTLGNYDDHKVEVDSGAYLAVIRIPANFTEMLFLKSSGQTLSTMANITVEVYLDGTKTSVKASILGALQDGLKTVLGNNSGVDIQGQFAFGGMEFSGFDQSIPSVMGFVLTLLVLIISSLILKRETIGGTEERLLTTPLRVSERLLGYVVALLILSMLMIGAILVIGVFVFAAVIQGSFLLLILLLILFGLTNIFMSVFLSNFARNEIQAVQAAVLISLPSMALAGIFMPVISFPPYVQTISHFIPLYYGVRIFEGIMLKGWGVDMLWPDILAISIFAAAFLILALVTVKDKLDL